MKTMFAANVIIPTDAVRIYGTPIPNTVFRNAVGFIPVFENQRDVVGLDVAQHLRPIEIKERAFVNFEEV